MTTRTSSPDDRDDRDDRDGRNDDATMLVDGAAVRERRLELGLSERKLAERFGAGVSQSVMRGIEAGINHDVLSLGELRRLAELLDLPLGKLLGPSASGRRVAAVVGPSTFAQHLDEGVAWAAAVLNEVHRPMPRQVLATLSGLTLPEVDDVLDELDARLGPAGLRLRRVHGEISIVAATEVLSPTARREAWRQHLARRSLDVAQARLVRRAVLGQTVKALREDERLRGGALVNAGILCRTRSGGLAASADVEFSLGLTSSDDQSQTTAG